MSHTDFLSLTLDNAGCFKHVHMPLNDQGLVHIRGVNLDEGGSNGAGKSSLFEFLFYLWYDRLTKSDRRVKKDELLNVYSPSNFLIHSEVLKDGVPYAAEKYRKVKGRGSGVDLWENGTLITPDDPREAQKAITGVLGRSWNETLGSVYLSQRHTHKMIDGTPAEKKEYMSKYFGLDSLDNMISSTEKRIASVPLPDETHLHTILKGVEADLEVLGDIQEIVDSYVSTEEKRDTLQDKLIAAKTDLRKQEEAKETKEESRQWKKFLRTSFNLPLDLSLIKEALGASRAQVASVSMQLRSASARESLLAEIESIGGVPDEDSAARLDELSCTVSSLDRLLPQLEQRKKLEDSLDELWEEDMDIDTLSSKEELWSTRLTTYTSQLSAVASELSRLGKVGDSCYACLRPLSSDSKEEMVQEREVSQKKLAEKCAKAEAALDAYTQRLDSLNKKNELLSRLQNLPLGEAEESRAALLTARREHAALKALQSNFMRLGVLNAKLSDLPVVAETSDVLEARLRDSKKACTGLEDAHQWLLQYGGVTFDVHAYQRLSTAVETYAFELKKANASLLSLRDKRSQHKALRKQKKDLKTTLNAASAEKNRVRVLRYITVTLGELKKLGLRESTKLLSSVLPIYLNQLFPKGDIELSETDDASGFDLVFNKGGKTIPLTVISGGQAKRVGLAIVFAFAKMGRNTSNLLICDEPFRDLDKNGREACFEVLRDFDIGTLLVTSHDQDINASKKYDQVWTVQMKNNISTLYLDS